MSELTDTLLRCKYCGVLLVPNNKGTCDSCGAPIEFDPKSDNPFALWEYHKQNAKLYPPTTMGTSNCGE